MRESLVSRFKFLVRRRLDARFQLWRRGVEIVERNFDCGAEKAQASLRMKDS